MFSNDEKTSKYLQEVLGLAGPGEVPLPALVCRAVHLLAQGGPFCHGAHALPKAGIRPILSTFGRRKCPLQTGLRV